ncbi:hypothetical protein GCM10011332_29360 [Terasakiella brassicae]|uniref:Uncharacterized protein n=1 Tax=Terasakiella brassicae TaxID=1634917 RepID=A0A917C779_9PROT|nr:hypothetical protein [Terasakiella brassicae]GGF73420.1 hypothetical protein GCM10011332_29360 [Terasakiella brassicae]
MSDWKKVEKWQNPTDEDKPFKQHFVETLIALKTEIEVHRKHRIRKEMDELIAPPPSFSDRADRIRRNLLIVAGVAVFYKSFDLKITAASSPSTAFLGLKIEGLTPVAIDTGLTFLVAYLLAHFFVEAATAHLQYFGHTFGRTYEETSTRWLLTVWRIRYFLLESVIPLGLGYWALQLLPVKAAFFGWML